MFKNLKIATKIKTIVLSLLVFISIAFVENKNEETVCEKLVVNIENTDGNYFLDEEAILDLLTGRGKHPVIGEKLIHIALKTLESRVKKDKFVEDVQITKNLTGTLTINVTQRRPIARFLRADTSFYVGSEGHVLPLSNRYTARVLVISGTGVRNYFKTDSAATPQDKELYELLVHINNDEFLKAQIAEIEIDRRGELMMYPQVTKQTILFGTCEKHVDKFKRLRVFYDKILPAKGWNGYETVNLKYQDQIICK